MNYRLRNYLMLGTAVLGVTLALAGPATAADDDAAANDDAIDVSLTPSVTFVHVDGDSAKFREDMWLSDGWSGGADEATLDYMINDNWALHVDARAVFDEHDYDIQLEIINPDLGFFRAGYTEFRKYYDGTGGYYKPFGVKPFELDNDLHLDTGEFFAEIGLTLPDWPRIVLGYTYKFKDGEKSLLEWGSVVDAGTTRKIFPSYKMVDEEIDIFRADISHDLGKVHLENRFVYEHAHVDTKRVDQEVNLVSGAAESVTIKESYSHDSFYNTFHMESHLNDEVYWSLGHMFNSLDGNAGFDMMTVPFAAPFDKNWFTQMVDLDVDSHVINGNLFYQPDPHVALYGGLQFESTDTDGHTDAILEEVGFGGLEMPNAIIRTSEDRGSLEERIGVRFTRIPWTTVYAEGAWNQQDVDLNEHETEDGLLAFQRKTDTDVKRQKYTVGFNTAPLPAVTWSGRYRYRNTENDYDNKVDTEPGYSAFIDFQEFESDELSTRLTWKACARVRLSFQFQLVATDITTRTDASTSKKLTGNYDSQVYSLGITTTPIARMYVSSLLSYRDARTSSWDSGVPSVTSYEGDVYSIVTTCGYAVTEDVDLSVQYAFSKSDNFTNNAAAGLPLGVDNERHAVRAMITSRLAENVVVRVGYGYFDYQDNTAGGADDYSAHLGTGSISMKF